MNTAILRARIPSVNGRALAKFAGKASLWTMRFMGRACVFFVRHWGFCLIGFPLLFLLVLFVVIPFITGRVSSVFTGTPQASVVQTVSEYFEAESAKAEADKEFPDRAAIRKRDEALARIEKYTKRAAEYEAKNEKQMAKFTKDQIANEKRQLVALEDTVAHPEREFEERIASAAETIKYLQKATGGDTTIQNEQLANAIETMAKAQAGLSRVLSEMTPERRAEAQRVLEAAEVEKHEAAIAEQEKIAKAARTCIAEMKTLRELKVGPNEVAQRDFYLRRHESFNCPALLQAAEKKIAELKG